MADAEQRLGDRAEASGSTSRDDRSETATGREVEGPESSRTGLLSRTWRALSRPTAPHQRGRIFWQTIAFATLLGVTIVLDAFSEESLTAPMLAPLMMVIFGFGELSARPTHVALTRLLGGAVFVTWLILIPILWV